MFKHKHKWKAEEVIVLFGKYPRVVLRCKCGEICHASIPSMKKFLEERAK